MEDGVWLSYPGGGHGAPLSAALLAPAGDLNAGLLAGRHQLRGLLRRATVQGLQGAEVQVAVIVFTRMSG